MLRRLDVTATGAGTVMEPVTDVTVMILDEGFEFSPSLTAGHHTLRVLNSAPARLFLASPSCVGDASSVSRACALPRRVEPKPRESKRRARCSECDPIPKLTDV